MRLVIFTSLLLFSCVKKGVESDSPDTGSGLSEISLSSKAILEKILKDKSDKASQEFLADVDFRLSINTMDKNKDKKSCKGESKDLVVSNPNGGAKTAVVTQECFYEANLQIFSKSVAKIILGTKDDKQEFSPKRGEKTHNLTVKVCAIVVNGIIDPRLKPEVKDCISVATNPSGQADIKIDVSFGNDNNSLTAAQTALTSVTETVAKIKAHPQYETWKRGLGPNAAFLQIDTALPKLKETFDAFGRSETCQNSHKSLLKGPNSDWSAVFTRANAELVSLKPDNAVASAFNDGLSKLLVGIQQVSKEICKI